MCSSGRKGNGTLLPTHGIRHSLNYMNYELPHAPRDPRYKKSDSSSYKKRPSLTKLCLGLFYLLLCKQKSALYTVPKSSCGQAQSNHDVKYTAPAALHRCQRAAKLALILRVSYGEPAKIPMHIQIIPDTEDIFDHDVVLKNAAMLVSNGTTVAIGTSCSSEPETLVVTVAKEQDRIAIRVPRLPAIHTTHSLSTSAVVSAIAGLLGYRSVRLTRITVRDALGRKIRTEPILYVSATPALAMPASLALRRDLVSPRTPLLSDTAFPCHAECNILLSLLSQRDLVFADTDTEALYRITLQKARILVFREHPVCLSFPVEAAFLLTSLRTAAAHLSPPLRTAFLSPFDEDTDTAFYEELSKVALADDAHALGRLASFMRVCPPLLDHRAQYIKCILDTLSNHNICTEGCSVAACTEYLKIRRALPIDRVPAGSLTELCSTDVREDPLSER